MSAGDTSETKATEQIPATAERREMAVRRDGALIAGAGAVAALALGAVAVGALAIGKMAIGHLALGRTRVRSGQVDELRIACLTSESWMARVRFQCPECGFGDHEVGHLAAEDDVCIVCLEEEGRQIRVECGEEGEGAQARLRERLLVA
jgi:hypothetical protein